MSTEKMSLSNLLEKELGQVSFGGFLRGARASKDLTQTEMAKMLGMAKSTLCDIEKGRQRVSASLAKKIAIKAGLSVEVAIQACLQDQIRKVGMKHQVKLIA